MEIGSKVFCFDAKTKKVFEGEVGGLQISGGQNPGYLLIAVTNSGIEKKILESAHIHETKEAAESHAKRVIPIIDDIDNRIKETTAYVDKRRIEVIGDPKYADLAKKIMGESGPKLVPALGPK